VEDERDDRCRGAVIVKRVEVGEHHDDQASHERGGGALTHVKAEEARAG